MTDHRHFAAALGFAFVAAWIAFNLGYALLCLVGAAVFHAAAGVAAGSVDLGELQARFGPRADAPPPPSKPRTRPRVQ